MTRTFSVDGNNDLTLDASDHLAQATGLQAVLQLCAHAAKAVLNEMVLAQGEGIPYFEAVFTGRPNVSVFEAALRTRLLAVEGVDAIVALQTRQIGSALGYAATIRTIYGEGPVNG